MRIQPGRHENEENVSISVTDKCQNRRNSSRWDNSQKLYRSENQFNCTTCCQNKLMGKRKLYLK